MTRSMARGLIGFYALLGAAMLGVFTLQVVRSNEPAASAAVAEQPTTGPLTTEQKDAVLERTGRLVRERAFATGVDFSRWDQILAKYRSRLDEAETAEQFSRVLNRALNELGISHIDVLAPRAANERRRETFGGIGVTINNRPDALELVEVRENTPADKAGLRAGDLVVAINGNRISAINSRGREDDALGRIRGEPGSVVRLTIKRGEEDERDVEVTRGEIPQGIPARVTMIGEDAAVFSLASFTEAYERADIERMFDSIKSRPYLVIDLRSNGGGSVSNLTHLLGLVLRPGTEVGAFVSRRDAQQYERTTGEAAADPAKLAAAKEQKFRARRNPNGVEPYGGQIAVLVNGASASASEIFAAAMRELREAPLVGHPTAGAVLLSTYVRMDGGFEMKVPTSDYVTTKGQRLEDSPLRPDYTAGTRWGTRGRRPDLAEDPAVLKALEVLRAEVAAGRMREE
jgi:carboxyl-terminal processing protease